MPLEDGLSGRFDYLFRPLDAEEPAEAPSTIDSAPVRQSAPQNQPPQSTAQDAPEARGTNSPWTRAPISVAPEPRQPFFNQAPRGGTEGEGILGGLLGPGLPGPL